MEAGLGGLKRKAHEIRWILFFFTVFFLIQFYQSAFPSWDNIVYLYQGKWFCGEQIYFEWLRPPLPGAINCILGASAISTILSGALSSLLYLAAVTLLYFKEKREQDIDQIAYAGLSFIVPTILFLSNAGGDMFALSFLLFALLAENPFLKGAAFYLATLSRYNYLFFLPLLLIQLNPKKLARFALALPAFWLPWIAYNYFATGNPFFSVGESIYLNIGQKGILAGLQPYQIAIIAFFSLTLYLSRHDKKTKIAGLINIAAAISVVQFVLSGIKEHRFLNPLAPAQSLNIANAQGSRGKNAIYPLLALFMAFNIAMLLWIGTPMPPAIPEDDLISQCQVMSDQWVYFYPRGINAQPLGGKDSFMQALEEGKILVIYDKTLLEGANFEGYETWKREKYTIIKKAATCKGPEQKYSLKIGENQAEG